MGNEIVKIHGFELRYYELNTLVIGSGAASLNAAVRLNSSGVNDIAIATASWGGGTSNNAGSDKQTYYKVSLSGKEPDSVIDMARDLFNGKCMHGDIALCEAQGSIQSFMHLVELGVEFPHDKFGSFAGYKTDHDPRSRASSAGPYTSKRMFEVLAGEVMKRNIKVLDRHQCVALLTDKSAGKVIGALAINLGEKDYRKAFVLFNTVNIVLGTGGPAGIYESSVYPHSQSGSTGMAFRAGATGQNLGESQFGLASIKFRWNLSGSYQQALPRYISCDKSGNDEREFLNEHFTDLRSLVKSIFLKGYQWPFDPRKIENFGSSAIDLLVDNEIHNKGRDVYLDFSRNPTDGRGSEMSVEDMEPVVREYLEKCDALKGSPIDRLLAINRSAYELYLEHGIDLQQENLKIAVCAQHNNGGLKGNIWWESDLKHLFPVGEVNGSHGVYRPGGSALNSGQVGSYRAAQYISRKYNQTPPQSKEFFDNVSTGLSRVLNQAESWMSSGNSADLKNYFTEIRKRMSTSAGIFRIRKKVDEAALMANEMLLCVPGRIGARNVEELAECFQLMDNCLTHFIYLKSIYHYVSNGGRSRGSYVVYDGDDTDIFHPDLCNFDNKTENDIIETNYSEGCLTIKTTEVREIPDQDLWFEKVWKEYRKDFGNC